MDVRIKILFFILRKIKDKDLIKGLVIAFSAFVIVFLPTFVQAEFLGQTTLFFVDSSYDATKREELPATLIKISPKLLLYIDDNWWSAQNPFVQDEARRSLNALATEFEGRIHPQLTSTFGNEWNPGIDNDSRITVLFHPMQDDAGGYTNYGDEFLRLQNPTSNEREMVYLNTDFITSPRLKSFLAHELVHLITFNQKEKLHNVSEEMWLNEARAEYASTLLGYDDVLLGSNLEGRMQVFIQNPTDSLIEWKNEKADYAVVNLFSQYLVDQYGVAILKDSLQSNKVGAASLFEAMENSGFTATFSELFTDWTIAVLVNDCTLGERYCYKNENLKDFKVVPQTNFLPFTGESTFSLVNTIKDWSGNWHKLVGGNNVLKVEFQGNPLAIFKLPYLIENREGKITLQFLNLDENQKGQFELQNHKGNRSVILIPSPQTNTQNIENFIPYQFVLTFSATPRTQEQEQILINQLLAQIEFLTKEIAKLQAKLAMLLGADCTNISSNLFLGMKGGEVTCLQEFLKAQGPEIYPEGLVTGNFGPLTFNAVIRFQEKYAGDILTPVNLLKGSGYVGAFTRAKINALLP